MPGSVGDPGEISSSPVEMMATLGRLMVSTESRPSEAATPISAARMTVPRFRTNSPASMSSPAGRTLSPASASVLTEISFRGLPSRLRSDSSVSSNGTTASASSGTGAPVIIRIAPPGGTGRSGNSPAATAPTTGNKTGLEAEAGATSAERTAYPSMAELASGGMSNGALRSSSSTRPSDSSRGVSTASSLEKCESIRSRASSTLSISSS